MNMEFMAKIRQREIELIISEIQYLPQQDCKILEIGAGTGWQAKTMADMGYQVQAIDLAESNYSDKRIWPILNYNGKNIPFSDECFDAVFSSSVLEHIPHLDEFQKEIKRVLKPKGIAIHILPSGSWRFWTNIAHYPYKAVLILKYIWSCLSHSTKRQINTHTYKSTTPSNTEIKFSTSVKNALSPSRHGEVGSALSEIYYFSNCRWKRFFERTGWKIQKAYTNRLFYSGYQFFGPLIPINIRNYLSYILGSSCHIYVLTKENKNDMS